MFVCVSHLMMSQAQTDLPSVIPPSPTVSSLMRFEEVPVDYYTGVPDINIPLTSKQVNGEIQVPLSLRYNPMGVRVDERSGWTGTGWALDAGGTIVGFKVLIKRHTVFYTMAFSISIP